MEASERAFATCLAPGKLRPLAEIREADLFLSGNNTQGSDRTPTRQTSPRPI